MTTEPKSELADRLNRQFDQLVNDQFSTPELQQYYSIPLTWKRALFREQQRMPYILNRRTCWAYVQARAPLDVKQVIWRHEQEELIFDERANYDHFSLAQRQARDLGGLRRRLLTVNRHLWFAPLCISHTGNHLPLAWCLAACHILERRNNSRVVKVVGRQKLASKVNR